MLLNSPPHGYGGKLGGSSWGAPVWVASGALLRFYRYYHAPPAPPARPNVLRLVRRLPTEVTREPTPGPTNRGLMALERKDPVHPALGKQSSRPVGQSFGRQSLCLLWYTPKYPNQLRNILVLRTAVPAW